MPIADTELHKPANSHIYAPASATILDALRTWRATADSYEWWWLIIGHADRTFTAIRFEGFRQLLTQPETQVTMATRLDALPEQRENPLDWNRPHPGVVTPTVVEQDEMGAARAQQVARSSPGGLLIVTRYGDLAGILSTSHRTFAFTDELLVDMLDEFEHGTTPNRGNSLVTPDPPPDVPPTEPAR